MTQLRFTLLTVRAGRVIVLLLYTLIALTACGLVQAQSGRRSKQPTSTPAPPVESESESKPAATTTTPRVTARQHLIVVKNVPSANVSFWTGMAYRSFVERLKESSSLDVVEGKELNRKEAIELAKRQEGEDSYVVWLRLEMDINNGDTEGASISSINPGCLYINYYLYSPRTGKLKTQGKVYQDGYQAVCTGVPSRPSPLPTSLPGQRRPPVDFTLRKAGREAAVRVLDALNVGVRLH